MLITCPLCGPRDLREFTVIGAASLAQRPVGAAWTRDWHAHLHLRDNPAGVTEELWCHTAGCGAWLIVTRDTITHAVLDVRLAAEEPA